MPVMSGLENWVGAGIGREERTKGRKEERKKFGKGRRKRRKEKGKDRGKEIGRKEVW